jgi:polysaccharide chain length determinant protein (PEP-CTERM system associated)
MQMSSHQESYLPDEIQKYKNLLMRHSLVIFLTTLALTLAAIIVIALLPDLYEATTTILVDPQRIPDRYVTSTVSSDPAERLNILKQQVESSTRLEQIIDQFGLYPQMRGKAREDVVERMRSDIDLVAKPGSGSEMGTFAVTYRGTSPQMVAKVANQLAYSFIDWNLQSREQRAEDTTHFMSTQLEGARENLQQQEGKLRDFKMQHVGEMPDQSNANLQTLSRLQASLQANADALDRLDEQIQLLTLVPEAAGPTGVAAPSDRDRLESEKRRLLIDLSDLKKKYTDSHPDVLTTEVRLKQVESQLDTLPVAVATTPSAKPTSTVELRRQLLEKEKQRLLGEQEEIRAQFAGYQSKVDAVPLREQQLSDLTRDYNISKEHYSSLLEKTLSAEMATNLEKRQQGERFTVIDPAQPPQRPFKPRRLFLMATALVGSFLFATGTVIVKDQITGSIKMERELKNLLPQSIGLIGSIPTIDTVADRSRRRRYKLLALTASLAGCVAVAVFVWRVHPIL